MAAFLAKDQQIDSGHVKLNCLSKCTGLLQEAVVQTPLRKITSIASFGTPLALHNGAGYCIGDPLVLRPKFAGSRLRCNDGIMSFRPHRGIDTHTCRCLLIRTPSQNETSGMRNENNYALPISRLRNVDEYCE